MLLKINTNTKTNEQWLRLDFNKEHLATNKMNEKYCHYSLPLKDGYIYIDGNKMIKVSDLCKLVTSLPSYECENQIKKAI